MGLLDRLLERARSGETEVHPRLRARFEPAPSEPDGSEDALPHDDVQPDASEAPHAPTTNEHAPPSAAEPLSEPSISGEPRRPPAQSDARERTVSPEVGSTANPLDIGRPVPVPEQAMAHAAGPASDDLRPRSDAVETREPLRAVAAFEAPMGRDAFGRVPSEQPPDGGTVRRAKPNPPRLAAVGPEARVRSSSLAGGGEPKRSIVMVAPAPVPQREAGLRPLSAPEPKGEPPRAEHGGTRVGLARADVRSSDGEHPRLEGTPERHVVVRIDRIEVKAGRPPPQPAKPRRRSGRLQPSVGLADYLARRSDS